MAGEYSTEQAMVQRIDARVTIARQLMHKRLEACSYQERGPYRSREKVGILKDVGTLKAALKSMGKLGKASAAAMQCLAELGLYHILQITLLEAHNVTLLQYPRWKIVLNILIHFRQNELQSKDIKTRPQKQQRH